MSNENCLFGMRCPKCGSYEPFGIDCKAIFIVHDDGTMQHDDVDWEDGSYCYCRKCDESGKVEDFKEKKE